MPEHTSTEHIVDIQWITQWGGLVSLIVGVLVEMCAQLAHLRFRILDPTVHYSPERTDAAAVAHRNIAERRDTQAPDLGHYRYYEGSG